MSTRSARHGPRAVASSCLLVPLLVWLFALLPAASAARARPGLAPGESDRAAAGEDSERPEEAAEPVTTVEETVVVSATRTPIPRHRAGSSISVLDGAELERRDRRFVEDLLRTVPGVEITRTGGPGKATSVRIRGGDASQTLVLVDGLRLNSATTGDVDFAHLTSDGIERIEVLRGPQAIYGSEASAGVISIVTARGDGPFSGRISGEVGEADLQRLALDLDGRRGTFDYGVAVSDFRTEGVSQLSAAADPEVDPYENRTLAGRFGVETDTLGRLDLSLRGFEAENELDGFLDDDPNARSETEGRSAAFGWQRLFGGRLQQGVTVGSTSDLLVGSDPDSPFNNYRIESELEQVYSQTDLALGDRHAVTVGLRSERRFGEVAGAYDEQVDLHSGFVQAQWSPTPGSALTAAVRRDEHDTFGGETTWRLTGSWQAAERTRLHGSAGTTFRAPDFNELFFPGAGDPELAAETGEGWDLGVEQSFLDRRLELDLTAFALRWDELIGFDFVDFRFANIAAARSHGVELELRGRPSRRHRIDLSWTWNETEDRTTGLALPRRPEHRGSASWFFEPSPRWRGVLSAFAVRDRVDSDGRPMDDYVRVDLGLSWSTARLRPFARIENLLDEDYQEVPGFTTPGRVASLGLEVRF